MDRHAAIHMHQISAFGHLLIIIGALIDSRPDGNHQVHAQLFQLVHHRLGIGEIARIELPIALRRPMEKINHNHVHRQAAFFVLAHHAKHLVLRLIAQLALPKSHQIPAHHGYTAGDGSVVFQYLRRSVRRSDPVVDLAGALRRPLGDVFTQRHIAHSGVIPQEAISSGRQHERNRRLRIALRQLQCAALQVQEILLILSQAVEALTLIGFKGHLRAPVLAAEHRREQSRLAAERHAEFGKVAAVAHIFSHQLFALAIEESNIAVPVDLRRNAAVDDAHRVWLLLRLFVELIFSLSQARRVLGKVRRRGLVNLRLRLRHRVRIFQCPILAVKAAVARYAHAQAVLAPRLDEYFFGILLPIQPIAGDIHDRHVSPSVFLLYNSRNCFSHSFNARISASASSFCVFHEVTSRIA